MELLLTAAFLALAAGCIWKPGAAVTVLGFLILLIGLLPIIGFAGGLHFAGVPVAYALPVGIISGWTVIVSGLFIMAFGRLVSAVEEIRSAIQSGRPEEAFGPASRRIDPS